jgi:hypothetical protein
MKTLLITTAVIALWLSTTSMPFSMTGAGGGGIRLSMVFTVGVVSGVAAI